jgi:hypothetical protein
MKTENGMTATPVQAIVTLRFLRLPPIWENLSE